jgi:predicted lysophospholipase L1 biosynthesis ABC-type transport system permease subunit
VVGAALGVAVQFVLPVVMKDFLPFEVDLFISWSSLAKGSAAGLVICVLFTLLPLLTVRRVSPLVALRSALGETARMDPLTPVIYVAITAAVLGFAILQTGHWQTGVGFTAMMALGFGRGGGYRRRTQSPCAVSARRGWCRGARRRRAGGSVGALAAGRTRAWRDAPER